MGNRLSGAVSSMILPVERYLNSPELGDFEYVGSLGSTRFLKVVKATHKSVSSSVTRSGGGGNNVEHILSAIEIFREGTCVLKVFVINDQSLPLGPYIKQIEDIGKKLSIDSAPNCLQFRKVILTEKAAVLVRQFGKDTLYDRLSTRPFLKNVEKRWIAFQLLKALEQCYNAKVCHGDIKSQNVLITSWNWVLLADFASFKPTFLPADNPTDFSYFFDTSRRRTCYIAPERFKVSSDIPTLSLLPDDELLEACRLNHAMDIFSLGCVLIELFTDGMSPFDFSQLLAYRNRKYYPTKAFDSLKDPNIREMITSMIQLDPAKRMNAGQYLIQYKETVFHEIFYTFVWPYAKQFVDLPRLSHDDKIDKLYHDIDKVINRFKTPVENELDQSYLIFVSCVTSLVRSFSHCDSKLKALRLLRKFAFYSKEKIILERILPYVIYMCRDSDPRIRAEAVHCVSYAVRLVKEVPKSDVRIFVDYVLPVLNSLITDPCSIVRSALAEEMALLADTAARFLEYVNLNSEEDPQVQAGTESTKLNYQAELKSLQEVVQEMVVTLLCDRDNNIRRALVHSGLPRLCLFFGRQKASDVLVSHLITFLNDKSDWRIRASFYECIPALAVYIGWQSTAILKPLLLQGFRDPEENVVFKTLACLTCLAQIGLLQKPIITELAHDVAPFLAHPNLSLRIGAVSFIAACSKALNVADVHCKLLPVLNAYLTRMLMKLDREEVLLHSLKSPIPRLVWETAVRSQLTPDLLNFLNEKTLIKQLGNSHHNLSTVTVPDDPNLAQFYQRLLVLGLSEDGEEKLRSFADILLKMRKIKSNNNQNNNNHSGTGSTTTTVSSDDFSPDNPIKKPGNLDLSCLKVTRKHADLTVDRGGRRILNKNAAGFATLNSMNPEWREMFGVEQDDGSFLNYPLLEPKHLSPGLHVKFDRASAVPATTADNGKSHVTGTGNVDDVIVNPAASTSCTSSFLSADINPLSELVSASYPIDTSVAAEISIRMAQCRTDLAVLIELKREEWRHSARLTHINRPPSLFTNPSDPFSQNLSNFWRPTGEMIANLHEHRSNIKKLAVHPLGKLFLSCSSDGSVKIWDCSKFEGRNMVNKSKLTYNKTGGKLNCASFLNDCFVCCSENCRLQVVKIEPGLSKAEVSFQVQTETENEGPIIQLCSFDDGGRMSLIGLTHHGHVIAWDTRQPTPIWRFFNPSYYSLATSMCVDDIRRQWACIGTDSGRLVLWDVRFQLPISVCVHPAEKSFYRLWPHPNHHSRVLSSTFGCGEVIEWDLESGSRRSVVWPNSSPPLSYQYQDTNGESTPSQSLFSTKSTTTALLPYPNVEEYALMMIAGDSEGNLHNWDLSHVKNSYAISTAAECSTATAKTFAYKSQIIDGVQVYMRSESKSTGGGRLQQMTSGQQQTAGQQQLVIGHTLEFAQIKCPSNELTATTYHHDAISDLAVCKSSTSTSSGQMLLVSASRDGVVKVWK